MKGGNLKVYHTALALVLLLGITSCGGDKKNKTSSSNSNSSTVLNNNGNLSGTQYTDNTGYNSDQVSTINNIKSGVNCQYGARLSQDVIFSLQGGAYNSATIAGSWQPGSIGGTVSKLYVGISAFNDLMFVSKITNGNNVVGYTVRLSMCPQYGGHNNIPYVANERPLSNFIAPNGITLSDSTVCGVSLVISAQNTTLDAAAVQMNVNGYQTSLPPVKVPTTFYQPRCN